LKKYKLPGSDDIPAELIQAGGDILLSVIRKLLISVRNKEDCLISGRRLLLNQFSKKVTKLSVSGQCAEEVIWTEQGCDRRAEKSA
jgi:hypothetical protein